MAEEITKELVKSLLPERPAEGHKGTFGHCVVVAGARGFIGAPKLTALGASRSGTGLVSVCVPDLVTDFVAAGLLEQMTRPLPCTSEGAFSEAAAESARAFIEGKDAFALGPGIGQSDETKSFVCALMTDPPAPAVVDADGLNNLAAANCQHLLAQCIATPHPGEMARLIGASTKDVQGARESVAGDFAISNDCVLVLKGAGTLVATDEGDVFKNTTGNAGMASGGTGDVLTGLLGGLLAQRLSPRDAAIIGVWVHGRAGDIAAEVKSQRGMIARDVIEAIPLAWQELEKRGRGRVGF